MKRLVAALWLGCLLASGSLAMASPAQDLFDQASFHLEFYYSGPVQVNFKALMGIYQAQLDKECASQRDTCPYSVAEPVIRKLASELGSQDGHTYYLPPSAFQSQRRTRSGQTTGSLPRTGLVVDRIPDSYDLLISEVIEDSPAEQAGLARGDRIIAMNGVPSKEIGSAFARRVEMGPPGLPMTLTVLQGPLRKKVEKTLEAKVLSGGRLPSLRMLSRKVALIRIPDFSARNKIAPRFFELLKQAQEAKASAIVLDLRGNPGGSPVDAVGIMAAFVPDPYIISTDRFGGRDELRFRDSVVYSKDPDGGETELLHLSGFIRWNGPVAVLMDEDSASAAEYLADMIQVNKRGPVVGEVSGGAANSATLRFRLINGGAISVTISVSRRPDGSMLPQRVRPDFEIEDDLRELAELGRDGQLEKALQVLGVK